MKKILLSIVMLAAVCMANAEGAGWFFVYDGNSWATDASTEFQTTATPDVFLLADYEVTANPETGGFNYQITNKGWAKMYGWCAEADGNDVVGTTYKLGNIGNAWINCESGKYDITFNLADETILFALPGTSGIEDVSADNAKPEYFSISGVRMTDSNLPAGLYICRQGNKATKILIK